MSRLGAALVSPFVIRGVFIGTFTNTYAALPMALTGALSGRRAAHRVNETSNFFTVTTLPGALERYGAGFEAAAMVRLMHSMVRHHALSRPDQWDSSVYGMPIPQVDQMPAGLVAQYLVAMQARRAGRHTFTDSERAAVEFARYRCFLLGLPEELLPRDCDEIIDVFYARAALLRDDFDDATCGALVRATLEAYLRPGHSRWERAAEAVERSYSTAAFIRAFFNGDRAAAARIGVRLTPGDYARLAATAPFLVGRVLAVSTALRVPAWRPAIDGYLIRLIKKRLATYGHPDFVSDSATYEPAH